MRKKYCDLTKRDKDGLREKLRRIQSERNCHYCGIEENDFRTIWGKKFYGGTKRGGTLEIDHLDPKIKDIDLENPNLDNLVFACALCNMAKSNMFYPDEFEKVGAVIREIWQERKKSGRLPCQDV